MNVQELERWCAQRTRELFVEDHLIAVLEAFWELTALDVGHTTDEALLFELSATDARGRRNLSFGRQMWFVDDEPEIVEFAWVIGGAARDSQPGAVSVFGERYREREDGGQRGAMSWNTFRDEVTSRVGLLADAGYRLVEDRQPWQDGA
jgi:hypothetical protein